MTISPIQDRGMTEAEARGRRAIIARRDRAIPTLEDQRIFQRQLKKLLDQCARNKRSHRETLDIVRRWTFDYIGMRAPMDLPA